jgi:predicted signal transduction protein with EAL and GGDEF domain
MAIKKTMHELAKEFPEKTYRELEKYRDADRQEEAQRIITQQENEELKEDQLTESQRKQAELEPIEGINWEKLYEKEHKLRQEAGKEAQARSGYLQSELDRVKRENNDLHNKVAALLDAVDPERKIQKARESGL